MTEFSRSTTTRKAFLGKHAYDLLQLSSSQVADIYEERGLAIPVEVSSVLLCLHHDGEMSLADIARHLGVAHQLAAQRVSKLLDLKLLKRAEDPNDRRRRSLVLTPAGNNQALILARCMQDIAEVYDDLYQEIGCDLPAKLLAATDALRQESIADRLQRRAQRE